MLFSSVRALAVLMSIAGAACAQTCAPNVGSTTIHQEGLTERVGDIVITCRGGTAGVTVVANLIVSYNANVTNRVDTDGNPLGVSLTLTGAVGAANPVSLNSPVSLSSSFHYTVPADPTAAVTIALSGIRSGFGLSGSLQAITASVILTGVQFSSLGTPLTVATSAGRSFVGTTLNVGLPCAGSPLPVTQDFTGFSTSSLSSVVRVTEATPAAFAVKQAGDDTGVRLILRLSGYGTGVRLFVPDALVGSNGSAATSAGAFSTSVASGTYTPGSKQLLLTRVDGAGPAGDGGRLVVSVPSAQTIFTGMTELNVTAGGALAVYEVLDTNPLVTESVFLPVFLVYAANNCSAAAQTALAVTMGPTSTVATGTVSDPIPRYVSSTLPSDCTVLNDCNASYYARLVVQQTQILLTGSSIGPKVTSTLTIGDSGTPQMLFNASVTYPPGNPSPWLTVSPASGIISPASGVNNATLQLTADPGALQPGNYSATLNVDAGAAGTAAVSVVFTVGQPGITIQALVNAASFQPGGVVPGSYAALFGLNLGGTNVGVTFDSLPATITFKNSTQINLIVPPTLAASSGSSNVVLTVDGKQSNTLRVGLQPNSPGIFTPGIVNADGSINSSTQPALLGSTIAVYLTGLTVPTTGQVTVNIGGFSGLIPTYAGAQGTFPGLDQVNVQVPQVPTAATFPMTICIPGLTGQLLCSNSVSLYTK